MRYLISCVDPERALAELGGEAAGFVLDDRLVVVDTGLDRSPLYHRVKRSQPQRSALLVAPLADDPKMKGMAPGSTAWLRAQR